jgi:hypothetical protein
MTAGRTVVVHTRLAGHVARVEAARRKASDVQIMTMEQLAGRFAGGFIQPIEADTLHEAVRDTIASTVSTAAVPCWTFCACWQRACGGRRKQGKLCLRGSLRLWRRALNEGPAAALPVTLTRLRIDDGLEPVRADRWCAIRHRRPACSMLARNWPRWSPRSDCPIHGAAAEDCGPDRYRT